MINFHFKEKYDINDLIDIVHLLRSPGGCPWDAEQTHLSIRQNLIEETYEVLDALDSGGTAGLREELGDLLLQIVFHTEMESTENNGFTFDDVCDEICKKLIVRHPHVFGGRLVSSTDEVLRNWDEIKQESKEQKTFTDTLSSVPKGFPALMRAAKLQKRAAKAGFDWNGADGPMGKLFEELGELKAAVSDGAPGDISEELGDLLFSAVNLSRFIGVDAEHALAASCDKFISRFALCEQLANDRGIHMPSASLDELDKLWDEAKLMQKE